MSEEAPVRPRYGSPQPEAGRGGRVAAVDRGSPASHAGIRAGDTVLEADGARVRDVIDWQWAASDLAVEVLVRAEDGSERRLVLRRKPDESFGVTFDGVVFDGIRECENACQFCFVSQLPAGLRAPLYVRDDDYRLSFLFGNFVTLTNLAHEDLERIIEMRLSPLYVSLHAVDPDVRRKLVCATGEDTAVDTLERLLDAGIEAHVQIVLVPGVNDGEVLHDTLAWLAAREGIVSVGVVPLGFTAHQSRYRRSYGEPEAAAEVIDAISPWQARMLAERGTHWVWPADEFYLAAGRQPPPWDDYEDFPQYENGIGLVRAFADELAEALAEAPRRSGPARPVTLVTGELFAPVLSGLAPALDGIGIHAKVLPVRNALFGGNVSVAGLLTGHDIAEAVRADAAEGPYLLPDVVVNSDGSMLDDVPAEELPRLAGKDIRVVPADARGFIAAVTTIAGQEG